MYNNKIVSGHVKTVDALTREQLRREIRAIYGYK